VKFSFFSRQEIVERMSEEHYDLLIIGGGITGVGIALDAVTRGMKVALCEMQDFAAGTSSRSTKLIHGGLRYLKQLEIKMVADVGKERAVVYENAPHVTIPEWMLLPIYDGGTFGSFSTSIGLRTYDFLAGVKKEERRIMLTTEEVLAKEPLLKRDGLKGGGYYVEYRTDDARLTIEVAKKAASFGAHLMNYMKVKGFHKENGKIVATVACDLLTGKDHIIRADRVVNAAGPWVDQLRKIDGSKSNKGLQLTKGIHIVIDKKKFPLKQAIYFDTEDGRMVFAIPRGKKTYVGTTDTFFESDPLTPFASEEDCNYLIKAIRFMFPSLQLYIEDIESSWAGVRPLIYEEGKDPSEISRKDEIWVSTSGLISIAGGKLTGYRKMAETVVDLIVKMYSEDNVKLFGECKTKKLRLSGGDLENNGLMKSFVQENKAKGVELGLTDEESEELCRLYGSNVHHIYAIIENFSADKNTYQLSLEVLGKLRYAMEEEMTITPVDFFTRRTGATLFNIDWVYEWKDGVISYMQDAFKWNDEQREQYTKDLEQELSVASLTYEG